MTDEQRWILGVALEQMEEKKGLVWGAGWMEEVAAALRALLDENAALKANDPLAEMWRELSEYQPQADRDGHGESWRRMCEERTRERAFTAYAYATTDADQAALAAARAALARLEAGSAIAAIRRAKGER